LFYALGEILLVVIGILIALQVNNWNENRKERKYELEILKNLKSELIPNLKQVRAKQKDSKDDVDAIKYILNEISSDKKTISSRVLDSLSMSISNFPTFDPFHGVIDEIISSGKINLIRDDSLRLKLTNWKGLLEEAKEIEVLGIQQSTTRFVPYITPYISLRNLLSNELGPSTFEWNNNSLLEDKIYENFLSNYRIFHIYLIPRYQDIIDNINEMIKLIESNIETL
jgi:hypothetical protein